MLSLYGLLLQWVRMLAWAAGRLDAGTEDGKCYAFVFLLNSFHGDRFYFSICYRKYAYTVLTETEECAGSGVLQWELVLADCSAAFCIYLKSK